LSAEQPGGTTQLNQSWAPKEIIVVDDASTDNSAKLLCNYAERGDIKYIGLNTNAGVANARNIIIEAAEAEYIAFFDDDDISDVKRLERVLAETRRVEYIHPNLSFISHTSRRQIDKYGSTRIEKPMGCVGDNNIVIIGGKRLAMYTLSGYPYTSGIGACATCCQMVKVETYKLLGGFDKNLRRCEDVDLAIRHAVNGEYFLGIGETLVMQKITEGQEKTAEVVGQCMLQVVEKQNMFFAQNGNTIALRCGSMVNI